MAQSAPAFSRSIRDCHHRNRSRPNRPAAPRRPLNLSGTAGPELASMPAWGRPMPGVEGPCHRFLLPRVAAHRATQSRRGSSMTRHSQAILPATHEAKSGLPYRTSTAATHHHTGLMPPPQQENGTFWRRPPPCPPAPACYGCISSQSYFPKNHEKPPSPANI